MAHWIDNADSYICPVCRCEVNNPNRFYGICPKCGFTDEKDVLYADLEPCPFCGGEALVCDKTEQRWYSKKIYNPGRTYIRTIQTNRGSMHLYDVSRYIVQCKTEKCIGRYLCNYYKTKAGAIDAWNKRAENSKTAAPKSTWNSVTTNLPKLCGMGCLLCITNRFGEKRVIEGFTGYMKDGKFRWHTNQMDIDLSKWKITHWMPLPEPPKEKDDE